MIYITSFDSRSENERGRERDRERDRERQRERQRETERENIINIPKHHSMPSIYINASYKRNQ